jgi:hypothetical protein
MSDMNIYTSKIAVLADFYLNYRDQDPYKDFAEYNDIGLPLAYVVHQNLVETNPEGRAFIEETYDLLCSAMGIDPEQQYECFEDMLNEQEMGTQEP